MHSSSIETDTAVDVSNFVARPFATYTFSALNVPISRNNFAEQNQV